MTPADRTRAYFNNNPGNVDRLGNELWLREIRDPADPAIERYRQSDPERWRCMTSEITQGRFAVFPAPEWGFRCLARNVLAHYHGVGGVVPKRTVKDLIGVWAPPNENNTAGYIRRVCGHLGIEPITPIDPTQYFIMRALAEAIATVEAGGMPWSAEEIDHGLMLAGIAVPRAQEMAAVAAGDAATQVA